MLSLIQTQCGERDKRFIACCSLTTRHCRRFARGVPVTPRIPQEPLDCSEPNRVEATPRPPSMLLSPRGRPRSPVIASCGRGARRRLSPHYLVRSDVKSVRYRRRPLPRVFVSNISLIHKGADYTRHHTRRAPSPHVYHVALRRFADGDAARVLDPKARTVTVQYCGHTAPSYCRAARNTPPSSWADLCRRGA